MLSTLALLKTRLQQAIAAAYGLKEADPLLVPASSPQFGDYQANGCLQLARQAGTTPRAMAEEIVRRLSLEDCCESPTVAGPGFINLRLRPAYLASLLDAICADPRLGVPVMTAPRRVLIDFSSPNVAKEMHVGHLRSTIIGDCLARILEFEGHHVLRINHVGDWGTQFGMLIAFLRQTQPAVLTGAHSVDLDDLVDLYRQAKHLFDTDEAFQERARQEVVRLQSGEAESRRAWEILCRQSRRAFEAIYGLLDVRLTERGESFYNPLLPAVVADLEQQGLLTESEGALCVFVEGFTNKEGEPLPLIIRKSDGGYNYATTDLAALRYRIMQDRADQILYVTDAGQADHFAQVFVVGRRAVWVPEGVDLVHVPFGLVQGEDRKRLRTRSGETVRLADLLAEACAHARRDLDARLREEGREETEAYKEHVAATLGIAAVKYADLSQNRLSDYVFSFDRMLALQGNTAPYMIYAYVRIQGIGRKGKQANIDLAPAVGITLRDEVEITLAKQLLQLDEVLEAISEDWMPHRLCQYLFGLSQQFNRFYERCPVLSAAPEVSASRLRLCDLTARTIRLGLSLLGISVLDRL